MSAHFSEDLCFHNFEESVCEIKMLSLAEACKQGNKMRRQSVVELAARSKKTAKGLRRKKSRSKRA